ncbi:MAG: LLM class flavin-dependent oxidoreductase [Anaerolineales bacterium]|nr:LLM class flavin-dependent oxidoreductase [Anaerolineales bacterium]
MSNNRVVKIGGHFPWGSNLKSVAEFSRTAEACGLEAIWLTDKFTSWGEMWTTAVLVAMNTQRVKIGLDGTDPFRRNVVVTAHATASVDEISGGRMVFGMGGGQESLVAAMGIDQSKKLSTMREGFQAIRRLLDGERVNLEGEAIQIQGAQLTIRPVQPKIPMLLIGTTVAEMELAAQIADGILIWGGGTRYLASVRDVCWPIVKSRGGNPREFRVIPWIPFSVDRNADSARALLCGPLTEVVRRVPPHVVTMMGLDEAQIAALRDAWNAGKHSRAVELLTDEVMRAWAIYGTPDNCIERLRELPEYGVTEVMLQFTDNWRNDLVVFRDVIAPKLME